MGNTEVFTLVFPLFFLTMNDNRILEAAQKIGNILQSDEFNLTISEAIQVMSIATAAFVRSVDTTYPSIHARERLMLNLLVDEINEAEKQNEETGSETEGVGPVSSES